MNRRDNVTVGGGFSFGFGACLGALFALFFVLVVMPVGCLMLVGSLDYADRSYDGGSGARSSVRAFNQIGYFKNDAKHRIFTIEYKTGTTAAEVRNHASSLMYTEGRLTAAYYFPEGSAIPADGITLAKDVFEANDVLYRSPT